MRCSACGQENPEGFRLCGLWGNVVSAEAARARLAELEASSRRY